MNSLRQAREVLQIEARAVQELVGRVDSRFEKAVKILLACKGRVVVTGIGKSGLIGRKIASTLASTGTPALFLHPAEGVHGDLGVLMKNDVALAISHSGETEEINAILPIIRRIGARLIALTGRPASTLGRYADVAIDCSVREEACPLGLAPTASTTAALAMGDALAVALFQAKNFRAEDFAQLHPKGSLGKKFLKVKSIMHRGQAIPRVRENVSLREAILEMTGKRLGCTAVVDRDNGLRGVFTDHDLRQLLQKKPNLNVTRLKVRDVMNPRPKTIGQEELVARAIHLTETQSVGTLLVVDRSRRLVGIVHLHDLLKTR